MTPADVEATVRRITCDLLDIRDDEWAPDISFVKLHLDGDDLVNLACHFEVEFGIVIDGDTISWPTGGALITDLQARVAALGAAQEPK